MRHKVFTKASKFNETPSALPEIPVGNNWKLLFDDADDAAAAAACYLLLIPFLTYYFLLLTSYFFSFLVNYYFLTITGGGGWGSCSAAGMCICLSGLLQRDLPGRDSSWEKIMNLIFAFLSLSFGVFGSERSFHKSDGGS